MTKSNSKKLKPTTKHIPQQNISPLNDHLQFDDNQNSKEIDLGDISDVFEPEKYQTSNRLKLDISHIIVHLIQRTISFQITLNSMTIYVHFILK